MFFPLTASEEAKSPDFSVVFVFVRSLETSWKGPGGFYLFFLRRAEWFAGLLDLVRPKLLSKNLYVMLGV